MCEQLLGRRQTLHALHHLLTAALPTDVGLVTNNAIIVEETNRNKVFMGRPTLNAEGVRRSSYSVRPLSCRLPALSVGCRLLPAVCWLPSVACAVCCLLSVACCLLPAVCCLLSVACAVCCLPSVACCLLPALSVACRLLVVVCCLLFLLVLVLFVSIASDARFCLLETALLL
jgi:hypothetical protein